MRGLEALVLSSTFEDAWEEWNEAKTLFEDHRTTANFVVFWAEAEHALMLARHCW